MRVWLQPRKAAHESAFMAALAASARLYGHSVTESGAHKAELSIVWGWDRAKPDQPTLYVETGWLPRWAYQVSAAGPNARTHQTVAEIVTTEAERRAAQAQLWRLRALRPATSAFAYADPWGLPVERARPFVLVPLQVEGDRNLERSPIRRMQELVDVCSEWDPPCSIVFRAHPALIARHQGVVLRRPCDTLEEGAGRTVHQFLKAIECLGVVTLTSNVAHDACIWDRPVATLGAGAWPADVFHSSLGEHLLQPVSTLELEHRYSYVASLLRRQWTLEQASDVERYGAAVAEAMA